MTKFGLLGYPLGHSFSKHFFENLFEALSINARYDLYPFSDKNHLEKFLQEQKNLKGFNVTIPYKQVIMPLLDDCDAAAKQIGAVNVVKNINGKWKGYNTDYLGFMSSLDTHVFPSNTKALILGNGGAAQAVKYALMHMKIPFVIVSRNEKESENIFSYADLTKFVLRDFNFIINTTPLGMYPDENICPDIPYDFLNENHFLYDLVYNPETTLFLQKGKEQGAQIKNGLEMLHEQAKAAWNIWMSEV